VSGNCHGLRADFSLTAPRGGADNRSRSLLQADVAITPISFGFRRAFFLGFSRASSLGFSRSVCLGFRRILQRAAPQAPVLSVQTPPFPDVHFDIAVLRPGHWPSLGTIPHSFSATGPALRTPGAVAASASAFASLAFASSAFASPAAASQSRRRSPTGTLSVPASPASIQPRVGVSGHCFVS
jgi:hypothetical protein